MIDARLVRFAAVSVVLAGNLGVFQAGEQRLSARIAVNAALGEQVRETQQALALRPALEAERGRLQARLRQVELERDRSSLIAHFVHAASRIAMTHRTTIPTITASGSASAAGAGAPFETIPLELAVEGRYVDVLATIRALSNARTLASVDVVSLARKNADAGDATLVATLRVLLERLAIPVRSDARARPA